jgi:RimJ/RimL family protein N-acetyltransferase
MRTETRLVRQDDSGAKTYLLERIKVHVEPPFIGLLIENRGKTVGAVMVNDFRPGQNIELTVAIGGLWNIRDYRDILRYCFARSRRITMKTRCDNARALRMLEVLGFRREGVLREWFDGQDAVVYGLLRSEFKGI